MNNFSTPIISNTKYSTNTNDTSLTFSEELGLNTSNNSGYTISNTPVATLRGGGDNNNNMNSEQRSKSQPKSGRLINVNTPFKGRTSREQSQSQPSYNKIRSRSKSRSKSTSKQRPVTQNLSSTKEKLVSKLSVLHRKKKQQYAVSNSADNNIKLSNGSEFNAAIAEARSQIRDNGTGYNSGGYGGGRNDNVCDYCQSISHGKTRSEMYARLDYVYCSTQCTRSHQLALDAEENMNRSRAVSPYDESPFKKNNSSMGRRRSGRDPTPRNNNSNLSYGGRRSPPVIESKQFHPSVVHATLSNESGGDHHDPNLWQQEDVDNDYSQQQHKKRQRSNCRGTTPQDNNMQYSPHYAGDTTSYSNQSWHSGGSQSSSHSPSKDSIHNHTNHNIYIANTTSSSYSKGRAITDEYRDYNDELSKQLQLAKYQDELHQREQYEIRKQFINAHNVIGTRYTSPGRRLSSKSPGRRRGELGKQGVDEMNVGKGNYFTSSAYEATPNSNNNIGESSPGGYNATLHSMGVTAVNTPSRSRSRSRKKYNPVSMKQGESQSTTTTTEMTSTTPTLSSRGSHDVSPMQQHKQQREGRQRQRVGSSGSTISSKPQQQQQSSFTKVLEAENEQRKREMMNHNGHTAPQSAAANNNTSMSSWGYTDVQNDINANGASSTDNNSVSRAFENLSGWPNTNDGTTYVVKKKQQQSDAKTPRHGNLTNVEWDNNRHVGLDPNDDGSSTNGQSRRTGPPTPNNNKQYSRMQSSLSSTPSLHAISEEQSFGMVGMHPSDDFMSQQQQQERRLPPPPRQHAHRSTNNNKKQYQRSSGGGRQDHVVEDVVSIVSYYDDPSIDMGSLATNDDTLTTVSGPLHRGNSGGRISPYPGQRMITTKNKKSRRDNSKGRSPPRHDPPGESIDELLMQGIHRPDIDSDGQRPHQVYSPHRYGRDDPSFHGIEPEDYQELMEEEEDHQQLDNVSPQKKHRHQSFSSQQSPHPPPQLRSSQQEWEWSENGPEEQAQQRGRQYNNDGQQEEYDDQQDSGFNIEFPSYEDQEDVSIGKLTDDDNASYDEPPLEDSKQDDDTAANTLETVDLVAEVKRVWRHVQRYEKKKLEKKEARRESRNRGRSNGGGNEENVGQSQSDEYLGTLNEEVDDEDERNPMEMMIQQFGDMQNISEIQNTTSISEQHKLSHDERLPANNNNNNNRGRRTARPPTTPMDGRLGKHIRSTSAHSRTHTPATCNSPGLDSNNALPSQASTNGTEKDVNFLHEGVDDFFREEEQVIVQNQQRRHHQQRQQYHQARGPSAQYQGPPTTQSQPNQSSRRNQQQQGQDKDSPNKRTMLNKLHRSSPNTLEQYSKSYFVEETDDPGNNQDHLLSKPYDMTKTQSSGTGITQRVSNTSSISPALAQKYIKQRGGGTTNTSSQADQQQRQQQKKSSYNQQTQHQGARLNQSHSKEFQEAFQKRMRKKR